MNLLYFFHTKVLIFIVFVIECLKFYIFKRKKVMKKIYCHKCANLLLPKGKDILTLCVADCEFIGGIINEKVDIKGLKSPLEKNKNNNCKDFRLFSKKSTREFKKRILQKLNVSEAKIIELGDKYDRPAVRIIEKHIESKSDFRRENTDASERLDATFGSTNLSVKLEN